METVLRRGLEAGWPRYSIHPGDLAWWVHHSDPGQPEVEYWLDGDTGLVVIGSHEQEVDAFTVPGRSPLDLFTWGLDHLEGKGSVGLISTLDHELEGELADAGLAPAGYAEPLFIRDLDGPLPETELPQGWSLRPVRGEEEADKRRAASHAAFESTMEPGPHLERYLRFMRSPAYDGNRDLIAVAPDGRVASFMVWWPDASGIAQIEPFGTHPDFHRQGVGRALMSFALQRMQEDGMRRVRVMTGSERDPAIAFYQAMGFDPAADLRVWKRP
jgi:ribosomal protein S18 acetylase RimI-like enzyme